MHASGVKSEDLEFSLTSFWVSVVRGILLCWPCKLFVVVLSPTSLMKKLQQLSAADSVKTATFCISPSFCHHPPIIPRGCPHLRSFCFCLWGLRFRCSRFCFGRRCCTALCRWGGGYPCSSELLLFLPPWAAGRTRDAEKWEHVQWFDGAQTFILTEPFRNPKIVPFLTEHL